MNTAMLGPLKHDPLELRIPPFLARRNAVKCLRCLVEVEADKLAMPNRCTDPACPLSLFNKE